MQLRYTTFFVAAAMASMAVLVPVVGAVVTPDLVSDADCEASEASASSTVVAGPLGEVPNWQPDCVHVTRGGTVDFVLVDAIGHAPVSGADGVDERGRPVPGGGTSCFKTFNAGRVPGTAIATFGYKKTTTAGVTKEFVTVQSPSGNGQCQLGDPALVMQQDKGAGLFGNFGEHKPILEDLGDAILLHYKCAIHGSQMHGRVIIEKA